MQQINAPRDLDVFSLLSRADDSQCSRSQCNLALTGAASVDHWEAFRPIFAVESSGTRVAFAIVAGEAPYPSVPTGTAGSTGSFTLFDNLLTEI